MFDYKLELVSASKRSVVVVVAPLVALMVDQVQSLRAKGVVAAIVSSGGREGRVAGGLLASDFQSLISSSLALIERSLSSCVRGHAKFPTGLLGPLQIPALKWRLSNTPMLD